MMPLSLTCFLSHRYDTVSQVTAETAAATTAKAVKAAVITQ